MARIEPKIKDVKCPGCGRKVRFGLFASVVKGKDETHWHIVCYEEHLDETEMFGTED